MHGRRTPGPEQRMARSRGERNQPPADAGFVFRLRIRRSRPEGRPARLGTLPRPRRDVEILVGPQRRPASRGFLPHGLRRPLVEHDARSGTVGTERLRRSAISQHRLRMARTIREQSALRADKRKPCRLVPPRNRDPGLVVGQAGHRPVRVRHLEHLPVGQRTVRRLQRGFETRMRVRHHALREARQESLRLPGLPLVRRHLSRRSGLLPPLGRGPRLLPLCPRQTPYRRRTARRGPLGELHPRPACRGAGSPRSDPGLHGGGDAHGPRRQSRSL